MKWFALALLFISTTCWSTAYFVKCRGGPLDEFIYVGVPTSPLPPAWGKCFAMDVTGKEPQYVNLVREDEYPNDHQMLLALVQAALSNGNAAVQALKAQRDAVDAKYPLPIPSASPGILGH